MENNNIELEIWNDFKSLSESTLMDRLSYSMANAHFGVAYEDRNSLIHNGYNKKLENDEDFKINQFLLHADHKNIDWEALNKLYPVHESIQLPINAIKYPTPKFRTHKERRDIDYILLNEWDNKKEKLYSKIPNDKSAKEYLINIRWNDKPYCPKCGNTKVYILNVANGINPFKCSKCRVHFSEKVGTMFENSKLPLLKWYEAMYLLTGIKTRKISTHQLADTLSLTQKTAWGMVNKIQSKVDDDLISKIKICLHQ